MYALLMRFPNLAALCLVVFWDFVLVVYRWQVTGQKTFRFFIWNLFLAIIPYLASELAVYAAANRRRNTALGLVLLSVLFLPNAPYIITDLFHLRERADMPLWFDTMLVFSLAISGLALFYAAVFDIRKVLLPFLGKILTEGTVLLLVFLSSFGIYLGRYLRFNSWDVLSNTNDLFEEIANRLINPSVHTRTAGVTILYGAFLLVGYWAIHLFKMGPERNNPTR